MIVNNQELKWMTYNLNTIICAGWFDMFHVGHLRFLKEAKKHADNLIVVVMNDRDGTYIKGNNRPIINQNDRAEIINDLKCVDFVNICEHNVNINIPKNRRELDDKSILLWDRYISLIEKIKPKKVFSLEETLRFNGFGDYIKSLGIDVVYTNRTNDISTTNIENKIRKEY